MAVARSALSSGNSGTNSHVWNGTVGTTSTNTATITIGASDTIVIGCIQLSNGSVPTITMSCGGVSMTSLGSIANANNNIVLAMFALVSPASGSKTITATSSTSTNGYVFAESMTGSITSSVAAATEGFNTATSGASNVTSLAVSTSASIPSGDLGVSMVAVGGAGNFSGTSADFTGGNWIDSDTVGTDNITCGDASGAGATLTVTGHSSGTATPMIGIIVGVKAATAASLPPGEQSFDTPQSDRATSTFPPNLRHWSAPDRLILIGQDRMVPGEQSWELPPRAPDPFAQWRSWAWPKNLNLIGQDVFPPGDRSFDLPLDGLVKDSFSKWRSWTWSKNLNLIGKDQMVPGEQTNYLPLGISWLPDSPPQNLLNTLLLIVPTFPIGEQLYARGPDPQDGFAQWRSWTGSYNLNLIGQDAFPPGDKIYDRALDPQDPFAQWRSFAGWYNLNLIGQDSFPPGAQTNYLPRGTSWQPESPAQNLQNTLFTTAPPVLPPGEQFFSRSLDPLDPFAFWRSWTQSRNLNLSGLDRLPPGRALYETPRAPLRGLDYLAQRSIALTSALPPGDQLYALWQGLVDSFAQYRAFSSFNINLFPPPPPPQFPPGKQSFALSPYGPAPVVPSWALFNINLFPPPFVPPPITVPATYYMLEDLWINNTYLPAGTVQRTQDLGGVLPNNWVPNPNVDPIDANAVAAYIAAGYQPRGLMRTQFARLPVTGPNYVWQQINNVWVLNKVADNAR